MMMMIIIGGGVFCLILAIVAMLGIGWWLNYEFQKAVQEHGLEATLLGCILLALLWSGGHDNDADEDYPPALCLPRRQ